MEQRFGVREPNISPWRRAVCGDLTSAFDFTANRGGRTPPLPDTADFRARVAQSLAGTENAIPAEQRPTVQMAGQRPHRPLGYDLDVIGQVTPAGRLRIEMVNRGRLGATFTVHDNMDQLPPWHYTIGARERFSSEQWHDTGALHDVYDLSLRGPNGLYRRYAGSLASDPRVEALLAPLADTGDVALALVNRASRAAVFVIRTDERYPVAGPRERRVTVPPGKTARKRLSLRASDNWYDLDIGVEGVPAFRRRFAGKVETGRPGHTDPGISAMRVEA